MALRHHFSWFPMYFREVWSHSTYTIDVLDFSPCTGLWIDLFHGCWLIQAYLEKSDNTPIRLGCIRFLPLCRLGILYSNYSSFFYWGLSVRKWHWNKWRLMNIKMLQVQYTACKKTVKLGSVPALRRLLNLSVKRFWEEPLFLLYFMAVFTNMAHKLEMSSLHSMRLLVTVPTRALMSV